MESLAVQRRKQLKLTHRQMSACRSSSFSVPQIGFEIRPQTDRFLNWQLTFICSRSHVLLFFSAPANWPIVFPYRRTSICTIFKYYLSVAKSDFEFESVQRLRIEMQASLCQNFTTCFAYNRTFLCINVACSHWFKIITFTCSLIKGTYIKDALSTRRLERLLRL